LYGYALAIDGNDRIIVAGASQQPLGDPPHVALARFTANGQQFDTAFGADNGLTMTTLTGEQDSEAWDVDMQNDGKIVVTGYSYGDSYGNNTILYRYTAGGQLDGNFKTQKAFGSDDHAGGVVILPDDKIMVSFGSADAGWTNEFFALARFGANGTPDQINAKDYLEIPFERSNFGRDGLVVDNKGRVVVVGHQSNTSFAVARYLLSGAPGPNMDKSVYLPVVLK
jgi:uncharacterized delta-60 repeat protein